MPLTTLNQNLHRDLKEAADLLKWAKVDLMQAAVRTSGFGQQTDAKELLKIAANHQLIVDRLVGYADEVNAGRIKREAE